MRNQSVFVLGLGMGLAAGMFLAGAWSGPSASAQLAPLSRPPQQPQPQSQQILLDERRQELVYANGFRLFTSSEEVVADLGFNMPNPSPRSGMPSNELLFDVRMRLVMSFATAKRFHDSLEEVIKRYEEAFGPIRTEAPQPRTPSAPAGGTSTPAAR